MRRPVDTRAVLVWVVAAVCVASAIMILGALLGDWRLGLPGRDRATNVNTVIALSAWILVLTGSAIALIAYMAATGMPDLEVEISFRFSEPNQPVFRAAPDDDGLRVASFRQTEGQVVLKNRSNYAARHPGVRIDLNGCGGLQPQHGWEIVAWANQVGPLGFQWDGGADLMVHGRWTRVLPYLNFDGLRQFHVATSPELVVTVVADGCRPRVTRVPVRLLDAGDYDAYSADRAATYRREPSGND